MFNLLYVRLDALHEALIQLEGIDRPGQLLGDYLVQIEVLLFVEHAVEHRVAEKFTVVVGFGPIALPPFDIIDYPLPVYLPGVQRLADCVRRLVAGKQRPGIFRLGKPDAVSHKHNIVLERLFGGAEIAGDSAALVGHLQVVKPFFKGAAVDQVVKAFFAHDVKPVLVLPVHAGQQAELDHPQAAGIMAEAQADHLRALKFHAGDVIADRAGGVEENPLPVDPEYSGHPRIDPVRGNAEGAQEAFALVGPHLDAVRRLARVHHAPIEKITHPRLQPFFVQATEQRALVKDHRRGSPAGLVGLIVADLDPVRCIGADEMKRVKFTVVAPVVDGEVVHRKDPLLLLAGEVHVFIIKRIHVQEKHLGACPVDFGRVGFAFNQRHLQPVLSCCFCGLQSGCAAAHYDEIIFLCHLLLLTLDFPSSGS